MQKACVLCSREMGRASRDAVRPGIDTRTLCLGCEQHFLAQCGVSLDRYLKGFSMPVVVVAPDGRIVLANNDACEMLHKTPLQIESRLGGDVFECEYARLPGGCGRTEHCKGCAIRMTVMDTMVTGKPHHAVRAHLNPHLPDRSQCFLISTEKRGSIVFLGVEPVRDKSVQPTSACSACL
ncbi:MAG: hypothetical protein ISS31_04775 [Kiritimatiellae bacterium]|nr:hypothetical protein [Kiritimatiellia bacterium]